MHDMIDRTEILCINLGIHMYNNYIYVLLTTGYIHDMIYNCKQPISSYKVLSFICYGVLHLHSA